MKISIFVSTLIVTTLLISSVQAQCTFLDSLSPYQRSVAYKAYRAAEEYDLSLTAVAIAWQESNLGINKVRYGEGCDKSFGVMHTGVCWKVKTLSAFEKGKWIENMVMNDTFSIQVGVADIVAWQTKGETWKRGIEMYNAGYGRNSVYVKQVVNTVSKLKECVW